MGVGVPSWPRGGGPGHSPAVTTVSEMGEDKAVAKRLKAQFLWDLRRNPSSLWVSLAQDSSHSC